MEYYIIFLKMGEALFLLYHKNIKHLQKEIFEIKSNELRSLFKYKAGAIIVIGVVFVKKTQKTPKDKIKLAIKRLNEV